MRVNHDTKNRILIAKEKHGTRYFDARSDKALAESALTLLKERINPEYGYIQDPGPMEDWVKGEETFTDEQIDALPESFKQDARKKRARYNREVTSWEQYKNQWLAAKKAVRLKDGMAALKILQERCDHEYEGIRIEYLE